MSLGLLSAYSSSDEEDDIPPDSQSKACSYQSSRPENDCDKPSLEHDSSISPNEAILGSEDSSQASSHQSGELLHPYHEIDFFIPERRQRIPGKYLRPPAPLILRPGVDEPDEEDEEDPCDQLLPGMGTREFKQLKEVGWKDVDSTVGRSSKPFREREPTKVKPSNTPSLATIHQNTDAVYSRSEEPKQQQDEDYYYNYYLNYYNQHYSQESPGVEMHEYSTGWPALYGPPQMYGTAQQVPAADPLSSGSFPGTTTPSATLGSVNMKQKTFEELQEQDRQLEKFFKSSPGEYTMMRAAFKSTFRGTKTYRENNKEFIPSHFNQLTKGAKTVKKMFPKAQTIDSVTLEPKSKKQKKREAWRLKNSLSS